MFGRGKKNTTPETLETRPDYVPEDGPDYDTGSSSTMDPDSGVKRGLRNRHLSMMALAGMFCSRAQGS